MERLSYEQRGDEMRERLHLMGKLNRGAILLQSPLSGEPAYNAW